MNIDLRDYFAGLAMASLLQIKPDEYYETLADWAYRQADAMIKEKANNPEVK